MMSTYDNAPPPTDWVCEPKPWDEDKIQHVIPVSRADWDWLMVDDDHIVRGDN